MEKKNHRLPKTTKLQYRSLLDFLRQNRIILSSKTWPAEMNKIQKLWTEFASEANSKCIGPPKTPEQWKKVLSVRKANMKRKSRTIQAHLNGTGGGPSISEYLTDLEEGLLSSISKIHLGDLELSD